MLDFHTSYTHACVCVWCVYLEGYTGGYMFYKPMYKYWVKANNTWHRPQSNNNHCMRFYGFVLFFRPLYMCERCFFFILFILNESNIEYMGNLYQFCV